MKTKPIWPPLRTILSSQTLNAFIQQNSYILIRSYNAINIWPQIMIHTSNYKEIEEVTMYNQNPLTHKQISSPHRHYPNSEEFSIVYSTKSWWNNLLTKANAYWLGWGTGVVWGSLSLHPTWHQVPLGRQSIVFSFIKEILLHSWKHEI